MKQFAILVVLVYFAVVALAVYFSSNKVQLSCSSDDHKTPPKIFFKSINPNAMSFDSGAAFLMVVA